VGSEYFINSQELENKVRNLLPSQGGAGAGFDLSASTQIIPIIDLTESAEGSNVRADLQTALSFKTSSVYSVSNQTTTLITTTGYYRVFGDYRASSTNTSFFQLNDGATGKNILIFENGNSQRLQREYDFIIFLPAGASLKATSDSATGTLDGCTRQIADINGTLVDP